MPITLKSALIRGRSRWGDEPYLNRIIFCEMANGQEMDTTGLGISTYECDNEHPILTVDHDKNTVEFNSHKWSFTEYIELGNDILKKAFKEEGDI